jgi:hypothetical protein
VTPDQSIRAKAVEIAFDYMIKALEFAAPLGYEFESKEAADREMAKLIRGVERYIQFGVGHLVEVGDE